MRSLKHVLLASVALGSLGVADVATAQNFPIYGGGATFPAVAYRELFDCVHNDKLDGNTPTGTVANDGWTFGSVVKGEHTPSGPRPCDNSPEANTVFLYMGVGSGNGKKALQRHNPRYLSEAGLSSPAVPYVDSEFPLAFYPTVDFAGSDDAWTSSDQTEWDTTAGLDGKTNKQRSGKLVWFPALAGPVAVIINGKDGNGVDLDLGSSGRLELTREALCGIIAGQITQWNDPKLLAANPGLQNNGGQITFVHREDKSGTTFIFANAMIEQCKPGNQAPGAIAYPWPWADITKSGCSTTLASGLYSWPDQAGGCPAPLPAGAVFARGNGNGGMRTQVQAINGAIGYSTSDYVKPVISTGPDTANVQNQNDIATSNLTGPFNPPDPTATGITLAGLDLSAISTPAQIADAVLWGTTLQTQLGNPAAADAYPIAGFTMIGTYQCWMQDPNNQGVDHAGRPILDILNGYLNWHFFSDDAKGIIEANGFVPVSTTIRDKIETLFNDTAAAPLNWGGKTPGCRGIPGVQYGVKTRN
ncbi:MAG: hypothetical protein HC888_19615 [Candidatus Competibacteraceae bacterium]|nr:hypothetical protein [Candidatus Competibacteraceae bacterium]